MLVQRVVTELGLAPESRVPELQAGWDHCERPVPTASHQRQIGNQLLSTRSRERSVETMQKCRSINPALGSRAFAPAPRVQVQFQRRNLQDVAITRTGRPVLKVQGGR